MPVALAPIGSIERFDPAACAAVANAAGTFGCAMFQSSVAKPDIEETGRETPDGLKIFQLYVRGDHAWVEAIFDRAVAAGFGALCLTVDTHHYSRRERDISKRYQAASTREPERVAPSEGARLEAGRQGQEAVQAAADHQGHRHRRGRQARGRARRRRDLRVEPRRPPARPRRSARSTCCRRSSPPPRARPRSSSTAASAAAPTWSRRSRSAPTWSASAGCTPSAWPPPAATASSACWNCCTTRLIRSMGLLGVNRLDELDPSYLRAAPPVRQPHVLSAFPFIETCRRPVLVRTRRQRGPVDSVNRPEPSAGSRPPDCARP